MQTKIITFLHSLGTYDYALFGGAFGIFILLVILALLLRRKLFLAIFLILLSFAILFLVPTFGREFMYDYLYKNSFEITSEKRLQFCDAIVVKGKVKNESTRILHSCKVDIFVHKVSKNILKNYLYQLKFIQKKSFYEENILLNEERKFKALIEPFLKYGG